MSQTKTVNEFNVGDVLEPMTLQVTDEMNRRYLEALEARQPRYTEASKAGSPWVHSGVLLNQSNPTRSASHVLPPGMANVHAKELAQFFKPARVGRKLQFLWKVIERYEKRGRPYMVFDCHILDEDGSDILRRAMTSTFVQQKAQP